MIKVGFGDPYLKKKRISFETKPIFFNTFHRFLKKFHKFNLFLYFPPTACCGQSSAWTYLYMAWKASKTTDPGTLSHHAGLPGIRSHLVSGQGKSDSGQREGEERNKFSPDIRHNAFRYMACPN
jgi:hypothetical protein